MGNETYVWYSAATDVTGKKIAEALKTKSGTTAPGAAIDNVICWGVKTDKPVALANKKVYNHPDKIRANRDKLAALHTMKNKKCAVADFATNYKLLAKGEADYPIIGRTKFHQGGAGFWLCLNSAQADQAVKEGAQYFQKFIHIKDEYRFHIVNGELIYAVKKTPRENLKEAFVEHYKEHVSNYAAKNNIKLDNATMDVILDRLARKMAVSVDMTTRSNTRGWKFSHIANANVPANLADAAKAAIKALDLDFAAVDCCVDTQGKPWIIECNTGPGLDGSSFNAWTDAFSKLIAPKKAEAKPAAPKKAAKAMAEGVAAAGVGAAKDMNTRKIKLKTQAEMLSKMLEAAGDDEAQLTAIEGLWAKLGAKM